MAQLFLDSYRVKFIFMGTFFTPQKRKKPQNQIVDVLIERCDHEGNGIAYIPNTTKVQRKGSSKVAKKICFVAGALPGEQVKARVVQDKSSVAHAHTVSVLTASEFRQQPQCQHADECGGCQLAHWQFSAQQHYKQDAVDALLKKHLGEQTFPWCPPIADQSDHYRRRARVATWWNNKTQRLVLGFRAEKSKKIIPINQCLVLSQPFDNFFAQITPVIHTLKKAKFISHIELIDAEPTPVVIFRCTQALLPEDAALLVACCQENHWQALAEHDEHHFVDLASAAPFTESLLYPQNIVVNEQNIQLKQYFRPTDFIQVNAWVNQHMVAQALQWLAPTADDVVLDLFCGIGNFSLPLATLAQQVIGVEGVQSMVEQAQYNAEQNQVDNVRFHCADLNSHWKNAPWLGRQITQVLLDPARAGAEVAVTQLVKYKVPKVLCVSCHPVTFARDAKILCDAGYRIEKLNLIHMFPNTSHVELMALFVL